MVIEPIVPERPAPWLLVDVIVSNPVVHRRPGPFNAAYKGQLSGRAFGVVLERNGVFPFDQDI